MADVRVLSSGKFCVRIRRKGHPTVTKTFVSKKDAEKFARQVEADMDRSVFIDLTEAQQTTLYEALERYLREISAFKKGAREEAIRIKSWQQHPLAKRSLASLNPKDFSKYRDDRLKKDGRQSNTVRLELALISHLFTIARKEWGIPVDNPIRSIRKPAPGKARQRRLEGDEYPRLLAAAQCSKKPQLQPMIVLAVESAMRLGELLSLTWEHVDLAKRTAFLPDTKNGTSRCVALSTVAVETLQAMPRHIRDTRVFYTFKQSSDAIKSAWHSALSQAGIDDLHYHDLRHEAVSRLIEKGLNPLEVASISGHKTMAMLQRYTHFRAEELAIKLG